MASLEVEQLAQVYFEDLKEGKEPNPVALNLAATALFDKAAETISDDPDLTVAVIRALLTSGESLNTGVPGGIRIESEFHTTKKFFTLTRTPSTITLELGQNNEKLTEYMKITTLRQGAIGKPEVLPGFLYSSSLIKENGIIETERYYDNIEAFKAIMGLLRVWGDL
ncbi:MAG TPA: hypothetical protein VJ227_04295 [Patescibacteria group bacterium]|nr:hypothetical protein [Patescibacteria group bacterium]